MMRAAKDAPRHFLREPDGGRPAEMLQKRRRRIPGQEGWRMWEPGPRPWITLEGRRLRRWSLRREVQDRTRP